ncbi:hypothetical protein Hanom_Chr10g00900981 [Helianthus anomalus]
MYSSYIHKNCLSYPEPAPPWYPHQNLYRNHYAYLVILLDNEGLFLLSCCVQHPKFEDS